MWVCVYPTHGPDQKHTSISQQTSYTNTAWYLGLPNHPDCWHRYRGSRINFAKPKQGNEVASYFLTHQSQVSSKRLHWFYLFCSSWLLNTHRTPTACRAHTEQVEWADGNDNNDNGSYCSHNYQYLRADCVSTAMLIATWIISFHLLKNIPRL